MNYRIVIPGSVPASLNEVLRMSHHETKRVRETWLNTIFVVLGREKVMHLRLIAVAKTKMRVTITICNSRQYDKDNMYGACKIVFDAIKNLGLIYDDRKEFLDAHVEQEKCARKQKHTVIEIGPAEETTCK
jgi:hypothetical protein